MEAGAQFNPLPVSFHEISDHLLDFVFLNFTVIPSQQEKREDNNDIVTSLEIMLSIIMSPYACFYVKIILCVFSLLQDVFMFPSYPMSFLFSYLY